MSDPVAPRSGFRWLLYPASMVVVAVLTIGVVALLFNIRERQHEAREHYVKLVELNEDTVDPAVWGRNFPRQYDSYKRTVDVERTKHGGSDAIDKLTQDPFLKRMYAGYAFSIDFREERGHAYMLKDQDETERVKQRKQPGACLHCHSAILPAYRKAGANDKNLDPLMEGFKKVCGMDWKEARGLVEHPVTCVDCHDPTTTQLRVTRPGFLIGIEGLAHFLADTRKTREQEQRSELAKPVGDRDPEKAKGYRELYPHLASLERYAKTHALIARSERKPYQVNAEASRQELRSFVCGQCHVEYYFRKGDNLLIYPWENGMKVEQIEEYYDAKDFTDWVHKESGAKVLKAQHPEFELWNQGIHARSGVACADCHMPYLREGAIKVSDHHVRSPLLQINRACQVCHRYDEKEILARAETLQDRTRALAGRAEQAVVELIDALKASEPGKIAPANLEAARKLHRKSQWRLDFILAENSLGFHAPQESARILAEAIDFARQGQLKLLEPTR